jgi:hypothetical protein
MSKHYDRNFWQIIKYYYNDDGTRKEYPPRKGVMQSEYYQKAWYGNGVYDYKNFDSLKYAAYKSNKQIINALAKKNYGIVLKDDILYLKKVVGGLMVDETKAKTIKKSINLNVLKGKSLDDKISIIENLFIS